MAYMDNDGRYRKYGTEQAVPTTGGDFAIDGPTRQIEVDILLSSLTTSPVIQADTTFVPAGVFIESVEVIATTPGAGGTSFSVGLVGYDRTTVASNTGFVSALVLASVDGQGERTFLTQGVTSAGAYVGTTTPSAGYITALAAGTFTGNGKVRVRINYRGVPPITY